VTALALRPIDVCGRGLSARSDSVSLHSFFPAAAGLVGRAWSTSRVNRVSRVKGDSGAEVRGRLLPPCAGNYKVQWRSGHDQYIACQPAFPQKPHFGQYCACTFTPPGSPNPTFTTDSPHSPDTGRNEAQRRPGVLRVFGAGAGGASLAQPFQGRCGAGRGDTPTGCSQLAPDAGK